MNWHRRDETDCNRVQGAPGGIGQLEPDFHSVAVSALNPDAFNLSLGAGARGRVPEFPNPTQWYAGPKYLGHLLAMGPRVLGHRVQGRAGWGCNLKSIFANVATASYQYLVSKEGCFDT